MAGETTEVLTPEQQAAHDAAEDARARARQDVSQHPRMLAMQAIADAHEADVEDQLAAAGLSSSTPIGEQRVVDTRTEGAVDGDLEATGGQPAARTPRTPAARATPSAQLLAQLGTEPLPMESLDGLKVTVKIDGQDRVMTLQELRRTAQLDGAAHSRLQQANELLARAQTAAQTGAPPVGVDAANPGGDSSAASQDVSAIAKNLVQALFVGDEEAATATVVKLLNGPQSSRQMDPGAIARQVAPVLRQQMSQDDAEAQFRSDFKDVVADPILVSAADRFYEEARAEDPQKPYAQLLTEAGNRTRAWIGSVAGKPATGPARSTREQKLQDKGRIDNVRALSRTEVQPETVVQGASEVIAEMRASRGLG